MSVLMSGDSPVASDSARSTSSCRRRTCASISIDRSADSGSGLTSALHARRVRSEGTRRARARPLRRASASPVLGAFAICRMMATVPTRCRSSGPGSSASLFCSSSSTMRSPASARLTASTDIGRLTPSGATVIGSTTAPRSGTTGSSEGSAGRLRSVVVSHEFRHLTLNRGASPSAAIHAARRGELGDPLELDEIDPVGVVVRRVVVGMQSGREEHGGDAALQERPVVGSLQQPLRVPIVVLL